MEKSVYVFLRVHVFSTGIEKNAAIYIFRNKNRDKYLLLKEINNFYHL